MGAEMLVQLLEPDPILLDDPVRPNISPRRRIKGKNRGQKQSANFSSTTGNHLIGWCCIRFGRTSPDAAAS